MIFVAGMTALLCVAVTASVAALVSGDASARTLERGSGTCVVAGSLITVDDAGERFNVCVRSGECPAAALEATRAEARRASRNIPDSSWRHTSAAVSGALELAGFELAVSPRFALEGTWRDANNASHGHLRLPHVLLTVCSAVDAGGAPGGRGDAVCEFVAAAELAIAGAAMRVVFYDIGGGPERILMAQIAACCRRVSSVSCGAVFVHAHPGLGAREAYAACAQSYGGSTEWMVYLDVRERLVGGTGGANDMALRAMAARGVGAILLCVVPPSDGGAAAAFPVACDVNLRSIVRPAHAAVRSTRLPCVHSGVDVVDATFTPAAAGARVHECNCAVVDTMCRVPRRVLDKELMHVLSGDTSISSAALVRTSVGGALWRAAGPRSATARRSPRQAVALMLFGNDVGWVLERAAFTIASLRAVCTMDIVVLVPSSSWATPASDRFVAWNLTRHNRVFFRVASAVDVTTTCVNRGAGSGGAGDQTAGALRYFSPTFWASTHMQLATLLLTEYDAVAFIDALDVLVEASLERALHEFADNDAMDCAAAPDHNRICSGVPYVNAGLVFFRPSRSTYRAVTRFQTTLCRYGVQDTLNEALVAPAAAAGRFGCLPSEVHCMPLSRVCTSGALVHFIGPEKPWKHDAVADQSGRWNARDWPLRFAELRYRERFDEWVTRGQQRQQQRGRVSGPYRLGSAADSYAFASDAVVLRVVPAAARGELRHMFTCVIVAARRANGTSLVMCTAPKCFAVRANAPWPLMVVGLSPGVVYDIVLFFLYENQAVAAGVGFGADSDGARRCGFAHELLQRGADSTAVRVEASGMPPLLGVPPIVTFVNASSPTPHPPAGGACAPSTRVRGHCVANSRRDIVLLSLGSGVHLAMVRPMARVLHEGLTFLGRNTTLLECADVSNCRPGVHYDRCAQVIVVGACGLAHDSIATPAVLLNNGSDLLPRDAILYNFEMLNVPLSAPFQCVHAAFVALLQAFRVWEFAPYNFVHLPSFGVSAAEFVPFGYGQSLRTQQSHDATVKIALPLPDQDIPVLFFGSESVRRHRFLVELTSDSGVAPMWHNAFGAELERLVSRASVVLVVRKYDSAGYSTMTRVLPLLAWETFVMSEPLDDDTWLTDGGGVAFVDDSADAAAAVLFFLRRPDLRAAIALKGRRVVEARPQWELLEGPLSRAMHPVVCD